MSPSVFSVDEFVAACRAAAASEDGARAVRELLTELVSDTGAVVSVLGHPERAGFRVIHRASDLTILHFGWAPWMCLKPHNHNMWSVVAILAGREDNIFWRRTGDRVEAAGARSLGEGDVSPLGPDIIHSVTNPIGKTTEALHVYGGDFFAPTRPRSEWDPETLVERPWDIEATRRSFEEAAARARMR